MRRMLNIHMGVQEIDMKIYEVIEDLDRRFTSGNSVPAESTRITKEEFDEIKSALGLQCTSIFDIIDI